MNSCKEVFWGVGELGVGRRQWTVGQSVEGSGQSVVGQGSNRQKAVGNGEATTNC